MVNLSLVNALQKSLSRLGLEPIVRSYLLSAFDVADLKDVKPRDMPRALRFISDLQDMAGGTAAKPMIPLPQGSRADGGLIIVNGSVDMKAEPLVDQGSNI